MAAALEMRPKLMWRVGGPMFGAFGITDGITSGDWLAASIGALFLIRFLFAWREVIIVENMVAYERRWRWSDSPVDLRRLARVRTEYIRSRIPEPVLTVSDTAGHSLEISLRWFGNWRNFLCLVGQAADDAEAELDRRTADRIARICPGRRLGESPAPSAESPGS